MDKERERERGKGSEKKERRGKIVAKVKRLSWSGSRVSCERRVTLSSKLVKAYSRFNEPGLFNLLAVQCYIHDK